MLFASDGVKSSVPEGMKGLAGILARFQPYGPPILCTHAFCCSSLAKSSIEITILALAPTILVLPLPRSQLSTAFFKLPDACRIGLSGLYAGSWCTLQLRV